MMFRQRPPRQAYCFPARWRKALLASFLGFLLSLSHLGLSHAADINRPKHLSVPALSASREISFSELQSVPLLIAADLERTTDIDSADTNDADLDQQARQLYQSGQFLLAKNIWQARSQHYATQQNHLAQASTLSNLALTYQQLGQWTEAEIALSNSFRLLPSQPETNAELSVMAQVLSARGGLNLEHGTPQSALEDWQQADAIYARLTDLLGQTRSQINQAQALRELGFYRQSLALLNDVSEQMNTQLDSPLKSTLLLRLGDLLRLSGQTQQAKEVLIQSLRLSEAANQAGDVSATLLRLGHVAMQQNDAAQAEDFYSRAIAQWPHSLQSAQPEQAMAHMVPIELSQLSLAIDQGDWQAANALWPTLQHHLSMLPSGRRRFYHQIHWVTSLMRMKQADISAAEQADTPSWLTLAQSLKEISQQAHSLQDARAEAYALGALGEVYENTQQWETAQTLTEQALHLSQEIDADEMIYRWQARLGKLLKSANNPQRSPSKAIESYTQSVKTLSRLRGDLSVASESAQFSFGSDVEPIYRDLVSLLLDAANASSDSSSEAAQQATQKSLEQAQSVIESLRLAELDNYFKEACIDVKPININQIDADAAIFYTIALRDRLAVIVHFPGQPLQHFVTQVDAEEVARVSVQLRQELVTRSRRRYLSLSQQMYRWLIEPIEGAIARSGVETLVFVLDGPLQNIPMAALHNGQHFLIEDYAVALTPGVSLLSPQPLDSVDFSVLAAGLTESRQGLAPLPYVGQEMTNIESTIDDNTVLLNQAFTYQGLFDRVASTRYPLVHIATHGLFGSTPEETYLVAWDQQINVRDINHLLRANLGNRAPIELLVLSACETAAGDRQAALGLAGVAIKAGAKSTVGSLWAINDQSTTQFIDTFYQALIQPGATRAGAMRTAQLQMLADKDYQHPIYWAPYVLLGSWL